jgi:hypothetical protein
MAKRPDRLGVLMTPRAGNRIPVSEATGVPWAADNDCFNGLHPVRWLRFLAKIVESGSRPLWVACPDKVADAGETWRLYHLWAPVIHSLGLPVALVLQDGLEKFKWRASLPSTWDELAAVFVGGSTEWKLSEYAERFVREAKERGKLVHVGRVNSLKRIRHFARLGVDTFDGSGFSAWGDKRIGLAVRWIDTALKDARQPTLFDEVTA